MRLPGPFGFLRDKTVTNCDRFLVKPKRIEIKENNVVVPIYEFSDGRFCVDTKLAGKRKRITRMSLDAAKLEARKLINRIITGPLFFIGIGLVLPVVVTATEYSRTE